SFVGLTSLLAGMGVPTGMVRMGAGAVTRGDQSTIANLQFASWLLFGILGGLTILLLSIFHQTISRWALGTPDHGHTILLMGVALLLTVGANIQVGILNAHHRVSALAKYGIVNTVLGAAASIAAVMTWGVRGIVPALI